MLDTLKEFRETLDDIMIQAMHKRVLLYGYGYTGRFLKWYAEYYHSIEVDFIVTLDASFSRAYDLELFQNTVFDFGYKDISNAVVWVAEPMDETLTKFLEEKGFVADKSYFDFYAAIYQGDNSWGVQPKKMYLKEEKQEKGIYSF